MLSLRRPLIAYLAMVLFGVALAGSAGAKAAEGDAAGVLRARHDSLASQLADNDFDRPMHIESTQTARSASGDVFARVAHPFSSLRDELQRTASWCDILILHVNIKQCVPARATAGEVLGVHVGRKSDQPLADAYRLEFQYRVNAARDDYLLIQLHSAQGPLGTRDYRISLEAVPIDERHSFIHISYSYGQGLAARLATRGYLATAGSSKVGFTVVSRKADGGPVFVRDMRGMIERNAMRYYLAVESFLGALAMPESERTEQCLRSWHEATRQYARQLHEIDLDTYLKMKRGEVDRQRASQSS